MAVYRLGAYANQRQLSGKPTVRVKMLEKIADPKLTCDSCSALLIADGGRVVLVTIVGTLIIG